MLPSGPHIQTRWVPQHTRARPRDDTCKLIQYGEQRTATPYTFTDVIPHKAHAQIPKHGYEKHTPVFTLVIANTNASVHMRKMHTHMHTHTRTSARKHCNIYYCYTLTQMHTRAHAHTCAQRIARTHASSHIHARIHPHISTHAHKRAHTHTHSHTHLF